MKRPNEKLEKDLNSVGVYTLDTQPLQTSFVTRVELPIPESAELDLFDFDVRTVSKRGMKFTYSGWRVDVRQGVKLLAFDVSTLVPQGIDVQRREELLVTSFVDLCWNVGVEQVQMSPPDISVPMAEKAIYADLGWYLPSHFIDHLIDSLGVLNETILNGLLKDAVIYVEA